MQFQPRLIHITLIALAVISAGCTGQGYQQTLVAEHEFFGTQVSDIALANTQESARLQITVDYIGTQAALIATQSQFLKATLVGQGTELPYLNNLQATAIQRPIGQVALPPLEMLDLFTLPDDEGDAMAEVTVMEIILDDGSTPTPSPIPSPIITPAIALTEGALTAIAQVSPIPSDINATSVLPDFVGEVRLGTSVGGDDCVVQAMTSFPTTAQNIYISVRIQNSPANTRFITRWNSPDGQSVTFDFAPDFIIRDACIWFFIEPSDLPFIAGNWSVDLSLNNMNERNTYRFSIVGN